MKDIISFSKSFFFCHFPNQISTSLFLSVSCPNCFTTSFLYNTRNVVRYIKIGVKLSFLCSNPNMVTILYYSWRREKICRCQGNGMKVALLHCERQVIEKERDIREVRSDICILNSGPTQLQPMRRVLHPLTIGSCYLPFTLVLGVHARHVLHFPQG